MLDELLRVAITKSLGLDHLTSCLTHDSQNIVIQG
jgi:hypothetical protein